MEVEISSAATSGSGEADYLWRLCDIWLGYWTLRYIGQLYIYLGISVKVREKDPKVITVLNGVKEIKSGGGQYYITNGQERPRSLSLDEKFPVSRRFFLS